jgi:hypothetical protein
VKQKDWHHHDSLLISFRNDPRGDCTAEDFTIITVAALERDGQLQVVGFKGVFNDNHLCAVGVQECLSLKLGIPAVIVAARRRERYRAPLDKLGELSHHVVVQGLCVRSDSSIHQCQSSTRRTCTWHRRTVTLVGRDRPGDYATSLVLQWS